MIASNHGIGNTRAIETTYLMHGKTGCGEFAHHIILNLKTIRSDAGSYDGSQVRCHRSEFFSHSCNSLPGNVLDGTFPTAVYCSHGMMHRVIHEYRNAVCRAYPYGTITKVGNKCIDAFQILPCQSGS